MQRQVTLQTNEQSYKHLRSQPGCSRTHPAPAAARLLRPCGALLQSSARRRRQRFGKGATQLRRRHHAAAVTQQSESTRQRSQFDVRRCAAEGPADAVAMRRQRQSQLPQGHCTRLTHLICCAVDSPRWRHLSARTGAAAIGPPRLASVTAQAAVHQLQRQRRRMQRQTGGTCGKRWIWHGVASDTRRQTLPSAASSCATAR